MTELLLIRLVCKAAFDLEFFSDSWRELTVDNQVSSFINNTQSLLNFINQRPKLDFIHLDLSRVNLAAKDTGEKYKN